MRRCISNLPNQNNSSPIKSLVVCRFLLASYPLLSPPYTKTTGILSMSWHVDKNAVLCDSFAVKKSQNHDLEQGAKDWQVEDNCGLNPIWFNVTGGSVLSLAASTRVLYNKYRNKSKKSRAISWFKSDLAQKDWQENIARKTGKLKVTVAWARFILTFKG